ncbi:glycosyltransferase family 10 domain-containing protein [Thalassobacter stenotrophicus]|nr:glycosyltransferase family 10 [Thalassobacter stenotrophicus]
MPLGKFLKDRNGGCAAFFGQIREPRKALMEAVSSRMRLDTYGPAFDGSIKNSESSGSFKDIILKEYSYNLCPENSLYPGYYTEKVLEAFASGSLPITWADQNIGCDFNPKSFLNLLDYASQGYNGWDDLISDRQCVEQFESAALLTSIPSVEPLRDYVKRIIAVAR